MEKTQETVQRILLEPDKYLLQLPCKQVRTKLSQAFNHWLKLPEDKLMLFSNKNKVTLPDCVRIIDLSHFSNSKELFCSKEAEYSYEGKYTSKNPKEVMAKVDEYHQRFYKELTINGMKILD